MKLRYHRLILFAVFSVAVSFGCSSDPGEGEEGSECTEALECNGTLICNPLSDNCDADVPCTQHQDCGRGSLCDTSTGECQSNETAGICEVEENCNFGETCIGGRCGCSGLNIGAEAVPPNVMIVLDRSGSMDNEIGSPPMRKWDIAVAAVNNLVSTFDNAIRFGLVLYQGQNDCDPGQVQVAIGDMTAGMISSQLGINPSGNTPIADTLDALVGLGDLQDPNRPNFILLLTDGQDTCPNTGFCQRCVNAATALRGQAQEVQTFVVGFGDGVDPDTLNMVATAGGTALPGDPMYYQADNAQTLQDAFNDIGGAVLSCNYELLELPPDPSKIFVFLDGVEIPQGAGWTYDPVTNQIVFDGASCDSLRAGDVEDVTVVHGCPVTVD